MSQQHYINITNHPHHNLVSMSPSVETYSYVMSGTGVLVWVYPGTGISYLMCARKGWHMGMHPFLRHMLIGFGSVIQWGNVSV